MSKGVDQTAREHDLIINEEMNYYYHQMEEKIKEEIKNDQKKKYNKTTRKINKR